MWTETHYYCFPNQEAVENIGLPELCAVDYIGAIEGVKGYHVNARWWDESPADWAQYQIPAPTNPVRVFA